MNHLFIIYTCSSKDNNLRFKVLDDNEIDKMGDEIGEYITNNRDEEFFELPITDKNIDMIGQIKDKLQFLDALNIAEQKAKEPVQYIETLYLLKDNEGKLVPTYNEEQKDDMIKKGWILFASVKGTDFSFNIN